MRLVGRYNVLTGYKIQEIIIVHIIYNQVIYEHIYSKSFFPISVQFETKRILHIFMGLKTYSAAFSLLNHTFFTKKKRGEVWLICCQSLIVTETWLLLLSLIEIDLEIFKQISTCKLRLLSQSYNIKYKAQTIETK